MSGLKWQKLPVVDRRRRSPKHSKPRSAGPSANTGSPSGGKVAKAQVSFAARRVAAQNKTLLPQRAKGAFKLARWGIIRLSSAQVSNLWPWPCTVSVPASALRRTGIQKIPTKMLSCLLAKRAHLQVAGFQSLQDPSIIGRASGPIEKRQPWCGFGGSDGPAVRPGQHVPPKTFTPK